MLEKFAAFKIKNTRSIYGGTNGDGDPVENVSLSYSKIEVATSKKKSN
ncbi:hypothetical protein [Aquimarina aggregata]|nr:hypothetical protein [Aquimarina aggregata]